MGRCQPTGRRDARGRGGAVPAAPRAGGAFAQHGGDGRAASESVRGRPTLRRAGSARGASARRTVLGDAEAGRGQGRARHGDEAERCDGHAVPRRPLALLRVGQGAGPAAGQPSGRRGDGTRSDQPPGLPDGSGGSGRAPGRRGAGSLGREAAHLAERLAGVRMCNGPTAGRATSADVGGRAPR